MKTALAQAKPAVVNYGAENAMLDILRPVLAHNSGIATLISKGLLSLQSVKAAKGAFQLADEVSFGDPVPISIFDPLSGVCLRTFTDTIGFCQVPNHRA